MTLTRSGQPLTRRGAGVVAAIALVLTWGIASDAAPQQPRDTSATQAAGTAVIAGVATTAGEIVQPLRRVTVTLSGSGLPGGLQVVTDDGGRFAFPGLRSGRYTLRAEKAGYLNTYYGSPRIAHGPAAPLALAEGQQLTNLAVALVHGAALEGTVLDENGTPLSSAQVTPLQRVIVNGETKLTRPPGSQQWATTDDRGRYRLWGLPPGEYTVRAVGGGAMAGDARLATAAAINAASRALGAAGSSSFTTSPADDAPRVTRSGVYFPGVADAAAAEFISLGAAEERTGVDLQNPLVRSSRLDGIVLGADGQPLQHVLIGIANASAGTLWGSPGIVRPDSQGRFTVPSLTPARYLFFGRGTDRDVAPNPGMPLPLWTATEVTVNEQDIGDVVVQFLPGSTVSGRLAFDGAKPPSDLAAVRVSLAAVPDIAGAAVSIPPAPPAADGSFAFSGVPPGRYRISVTAGNAWSLRSAAVQGRDVLDTPLEVHSGKAVPDLMVTLTDRPGELAGTLFDQLGRPAPEYAIVLFSTNRTHWTSAPRRLSGVIKVGSDGRFIVTGLPAGEYFLAALTDLAPAQLSDPSLLEQLAAGAITITLGEGEKKVQDLKITAPR